MADISYQQSVDSPKPGLGIASLRLPIAAAIALAVAVLAAWLGVMFRGLADDAPLFAGSTPGELTLWMADQSALDAPQSWLGQYAKNWAAQSGAESLGAPILFQAARNGVALWCWLIAALALAGVAGMGTQAQWSRWVLMLALVGMDGLLFIFPVVEGDYTLALVLAGIIMLLAVLLLAPGRITKVLGFVVALSAVLVAWESLKAFAASVDYGITVPVGGWHYEAYPTLDESLAALTAGEVEAVIVDQRELREVMPPSPLPAGQRADDFAYADLRILNRFQSDQYVLGLPVRPVVPGRLGVAVRAEDAAHRTSVGVVSGGRVGTVAGDFAEERFLPLPRELVLVDLRIFNDLNLPHLQSIARAFLQPARRNGPLLLARILGDAALFTWGEALFGFLFGAGLGFSLGMLFAYSRLMERGLLPYVVASQTVPILAIAPMVVLWLGAGPLAVSVIAAYITFFPVTINTLRGLRSPSPMAVELMQSYAAPGWMVMWKLRLPSALPYIFTALKISATASVVGAIIGELPASMRNGLGRAILDFSSDYSLVSTPKLWAAIITAAFVGISFFLLVSLIERVLLRGYIRSA